MTANVNQNVTTIVPIANMPTAIGPAWCEPRPAALIGTPAVRAASPHASTATLAARPDR
jgi:hypothetical protein